MRWAMGLKGEFAGRSGGTSSPPACRIRMKIRFYLTFFYMDLKLDVRSAALCDTSHHNWTAKALQGAHVFCVKPGEQLNRKGVRDLV